jgi:hypothetical protein
VPDHCEAGVFADSDDLGCKLSWSVGLACLARALALCSRHPIDSEDVSCELDK